MLNHQHFAHTPMYKEREKQRAQTCMGFNGLPEVKVKIIRINIVATVEVRWN